MGDVRIESGPDGPRVLIDSAALAQAVYVYEPVVDGTGRVVDLVIRSMNDAARHIPLSDDVVVGARVTDVFVDVGAALEAANIVWSGGPAPTYGIERRGLVNDQPTEVRYEVSTFRADDSIVQISIDHTVVNQLVSADDRFRTMADESADVLVLLAEDGTSGHYVPSYANHVAARVLPRLRVGSALPPRLEAVLVPLLAQLSTNGSARMVVQHRVLARSAEFEITLLRLSDGQVLAVGRELVGEENARRELERVDRLLDAVGQGSFGAIHVLEPVVVDGRVEGIERLWGSESVVKDEADPLDLDDVFAAAALVSMVSALHASSETSRHGWVNVPGVGRVRSVEYSLVRAGDRYVLEFVERTAELEARTSLAEVSAAVEVQRVFLSRVSHELRSPLNVIHGYEQLLQMMNLPPAARLHLARIEEGVDRLVQIVDDLIVLGQLDQGLVRFERAPTPIGEVLRLVEERLRGEAPSVAPVVTVLGNVDDAAHTVETDPVRFAEVVRLLVEGSSAAAPGTPLTVAPFERGASRGVSVSAPAPAVALDRLWGEVIDGGVMPGAGLRLAVARELSRSLSIRWERRDHEVGGEVRLVLLAPVAPVVP